MSGGAGRLDGSRWRELFGADSAPGYSRAVQERLARRVAQGGDPHGEATFVSTLIDPPAQVLDAGCGTGRVGIRLAQLGYAVTGVDLEPSMLEMARVAAPELTWHEQDLATLDLGANRFDVVIVAGNVVPLLGAGALGRVVQCLARHLQAGGLLVAGFGLDADHLPPGCPVTPLADYDAACAAANLHLLSRHDTWEGTRSSGDGYAVSVHRVG